MGVSSPPAPPSSAVCSSLGGSWGAAGRKSDPEPTPQTSAPLPKSLGTSPNSPSMGAGRTPPSPSPLSWGGPEVPKGSVGGGPEPPPSRRRWFSFSSPSICAHSWDPQRRPVKWGPPKFPRKRFGGGGGGGHLGQLPQQSAVLQAEIVLLALQLPLQHPRLPQQRLHLLPREHRPRGGPRVVPPHTDRPLPPLPLPS